MAKTLLMLNVGDKVRGPESLCLGEPVAWQVADLLHQGYPAGSVTLCSQYQVALYAFDGSEPENENIDRQAQGNNRYSLSNIRMRMGITPCSLTRPRPGKRESCWQATCCRCAWAAKTG